MNGGASAIVIDGVNKPVVDLRARLCFFTLRAVLRLIRLISLPCVLREDQVRLVRTPNSLLVTA